VLLDGTIVASVSTVPVEMSMARIDYDESGVPIAGEKLRTVPEVRERNLRVLFRALACEVFDTGTAFMRILDDLHNGPARQVLAQRH
jgi:hypothetical protein